MPRTKKKIVFTSIPKTSHDNAIEERLAGCGRKESEHIIYVGELVERVLKGEFGAVLKALTAGRTSAELSMNRDGKLSSDRVLGRIEMADSLWSDLEQFVTDKDICLRPIASGDAQNVTLPSEAQRHEETFSYSP